MWSKFRIYSVTCDGTYSKQQALTDESLFPVSYKMAESFHHDKEYLGFISVANILTGLDSISFPKRTLVFGVN